MKLERVIEFDHVKNVFTKKPSIVVNTVIYWLHYRVTSLILLALVLLISARQFFGSPIDCVVKLPDEDDETHHMEKVINRYCWIHTTFSVVPAFRKEVGKEVPYPGVDKRNPEDEIIHHAYYQWVWVVLLVQAIIFYLPYFIWKRTEHGLVRKLVTGLTGPVVEPVERERRISDLGSYLCKSMHQHTYRFVIYIITELLNLLNAVTQIVLIDRFLGGKFAGYGLEVIGFKDWADFPLQYDPMMEVFPRMTKCTFHQFGPSGDLQRYDTLCVMPINIVNEKVFLFLWFWLYFLVALTGISLIYRLLSILCPCLRVNSLKLSGKCPRQVVQQVLKAGNIGDWFLMLLISKNINKQNFRDLLADVKMKVQERDKQKLL